MDKNIRPEIPGAEAMKTAKKEKVEKDLMGFLYNDHSDDFSNYKGYSYNFKLSNFHSAKAHTVEQIRAANMIIKQTGISLLPDYRYPVATRRIFGQVPPGERERRAKITSARKTTRGQVQQLC